MPETGTSPWPYHEFGSAPGAIQCPRQAPTGKFLLADRRNANRYAALRPKPHPAYAGNGQPKTSPPCAAPAQNAIARALRIPEQPFEQEHLQHHAQAKSHDDGHDNAGWVFHFRVFKGQFTCKPRLPNAQAFSMMPRPQHLQAPPDAPTDPPQCL